MIVSEHSSSDLSLLAALDRAYVKDTLRYLKTIIIDFMQ